MIYKTLNRKQKIEQHEPHKKLCELTFSGKESRSYFTSGTDCCFDEIGL